MTCVPAPAMEGKKYPFDTPGPVYVPPAGDPFVSATLSEETQTPGSGARETGGGEFTNTCIVSECSVSQLLDASTE